MSSVDDRAIASAKVMLETLESELPEWTFEMHVQLGPGIVVFTAEVRIGRNAISVFRVQYPACFHDLYKMKRLESVDAAMEFAQHCRRELRNAKKNLQEFGV